MVRTPNGINRRRDWPAWVVGIAAVTIGVTLAHSLEDFVHGVPARFGLDVVTAATLAGLVYAVHVVLIGLAARGNVTGYLGNLAMGVLWFLAAALDHLGELLFVWPYRAGLISKALEVGVMLSGLALAAVSFLAWQSRR